MYTMYRCEIVTTSGLIEFEKKKNETSAYICFGNKTRERIFFIRAVVGSLLDPNRRSVIIIICVDICVYVYMWLTFDL